MDKKTLVKYLKSLGIEVHTTTKARGHQGFFCNNRIDISKNTPEHRVIPTLLHEFAHFVHSKIEPDMMKTGGTFQKLFQSDNPHRTRRIPGGRDNSGCGGIRYPSCTASA